MASSNKRKRGPWILLAVVVVLLMVAALAIPALLQPERYRSRIEAALQSATGWDAELGALEFSVMRGMVLTVSPGTLRAPGDTSQFQVETLAIKAELWPLLQGQLNIQRIDLIAPNILLVRETEAAGWVLPLPSAGAPSDDAGQAPGLAVSIGNVQIQSGQLVIDDRVAPGLRIELQELDATLDMATLELTGAASLGDDAGRVAWSGPLEEAITLQLTDVRTEQLHPFLGKDLLHGGGRLTGSVVADWPESIQGDLTGSGITLLAGVEPFDDSAVTFQLSQADGGLRLDRMEFTAQGVTLTASGSLSPDLSVQLILPQAPLAATLRASQSVLPLDLDLQPPGTAQARFDVDAPAGGELTYQASGAMQAARFNAGDTLPVAEDIRTEFQLSRQGVLEVRVLEGNVAGGAVSGTAWIDPVFPPGQLRFDGDLQNAVLGHLLDGFVTKARDEISGPTAVLGKVAIKLDGPLDARALSGQIDLSSSTVTVPGWDLEGEILRKVQERLGALSELAGLLDERLGVKPDEEPAGRQSGPRSQVLDSMAAKVDFDEFPWQLQRLQLQSGELTANGDGTFDPLAGTVKLNFASRLSKQLTADLVQRNKELRALVGPSGQLVLPLEIEGPLLAPAIKVDLEKLALESLGAESAKDAIKDTLRGLLKRDGKKEDKQDDDQAP